VSRSPSSGDARPSGRKGSKIGWRGAAFVLEFDGRRAVGTMTIGALVGGVDEGVVAGDDDGVDDGLCDDALESVAAWNGYSEGCAACGGTPEPFVNGWTANGLKEPRFLEDIAVVVCGGIDWW
jgi:hypothetical protein